LYFGNNYVRIQLNTWPSVIFTEEPICRHSFLHFCPRSCFRSFFLILRPSHPPFNPQHNTIIFNLPSFPTLYVTVLWSIPTDLFRIIPTNVFEAKVESPPTNQTAQGSNSGGSFKPGGGLPISAHPREGSGSSAACSSR